MSTINQKQDELIEEFSLLDDWMDKYALIIEMGNDLPPMDESFKIPQYLIEGCQSRVWIAPETMPDGTIHYHASSDAVIVKGIVSMLLKVLDGERAEDIAKADLYFVDRIGLYQHLSPTRSNGLSAMLKQMRLHAIAEAAK
ncbi:SufE family protein [Porphyromonas sp. COT-108 OH1349]|uniref:SufE family protein n=1 Tax=Porphyromonas sp. COT-108 OH1349 TaxID=1537504 RepID=UPI00052B61B8|nr:SufE family protein [Porphyromonas sp. COT-108 OH1349]KGN67880.1 Fe-S metabolism protein SufE [Porphyromonas sp. COT-108 OH1349]